ncbi:uncharacterized protein TRAVEDRAFT_54046 [Trametes versicolor FP-101664 SS1]|uniref:DUF6534 domain-containing protein n=1 Tax=Trametes versicolor (strain FP-101664) TaxID=717944 RepID=R7S8V8_TRAVS|nr:uncharacterized protein TRAVEDRAFT_54046 [Trametes versicolor FP-101664 SS1]EIW52067.1 hypothetical protein TRAVEDRAFT_54046 [Trametes versicolor FP-101664 SS1]
MDTESTLMPLSLANMNETLGVLFIGTMVATVLYGVTLHQVQKYYKLYPQDIHWYRVLVPSLFVLETVHTALTADTYYYYLITGHGNAAHLLEYRVSLKIIILTTVRVVPESLPYFANASMPRVYIASDLVTAATSPSGRLYFHLQLVGLALAQLGFCIAIAIEAFGSSSILISVTNSWMISAAYGCAFAGDLLITGTMAFILLQSRTGFKQTDSAVKALIVYSINTELVTSVVGIVVLIFAVAWPKEYVGVAFSFISQRLYSNMVFAVLNSRRSLAARMYEISGEMHTIGVHARVDFPHRTAGPGLDEASEVPVVLALTENLQTERGARSALGESESDKTNAQIYA